MQPLLSLIIKDCLIIVPDFVHVLYDGKIIRSGGKELAIELEEKGYDWLKEEVTI